MKKRSLLALISLILTFFSYPPKNVTAAELLTNGGFETGNFTGWTTVNGLNWWRSWTVSTAGAGGGFIPLPVVTSPQEGLRDAWQGIAGDNGATFYLYQDVAVPAAQTASLSWKHRFQQDLISFCGPPNVPTFPCGTTTYRVQILNTSNVVLATVYTTTAMPGTFTDTGWLTRYVSLTPWAGQTIRIRFSTVVTQTYDGPGQLEVDAVSVQSPAAPSAANVSAGGRVLTANGQGIRNVVVSLTDMAGNTRTAVTGTLGYYNFDQIPAGQIVTISVGAKKYTFSQPTQVVNLQEDVRDLNFVADAN